MVRAKTKPKAKPKAKPAPKQTKKVSKPKTSKRKGKGLEIQKFKKCPKCSSEKGFYVYLMPKKVKVKNSFDLRMSCPECMQKYQIGLIME